MEPFQNATVFLATLGIIVNLYFVGIRPASKDARSEGSQFYKDHAQECHNLDGRAVFEIAREISNSPLAHFFEKRPKDASSSTMREIVDGARDLEPEFTKIARRVKEASHRQRLERIVEGHENLGLAIKGGGKAASASILFLMLSVLWWTNPMDSPSYTSAGVFLGLLAAGAGVVALMIWYGYDQRSKRVSKEKKALEQAIKDKIHFAETTVTPPEFVPTFEEIAKAWEAFKPLAAPTDGEDPASP